MHYFVFRNNTIELFFPKGFSFSGYDDISVIPKEVDGYVWFYQLPLRFNEETLCEEIYSFTSKLSIVLNEIGTVKPLLLFTLDDCITFPLTKGTAVLKAVNYYNSSLLDMEKNNSNVIVLDIREFSRLYPSESLIDWKYWCISQLGLNPRLSKQFNGWFNRKIEQVSLKRKKCIVLDIDNTLWGGILGEDGIEGVKIGGDYPGKAYQMFQEALFELSKSGVILSLCSKNNEDEVFEAFEKNPFMVLNKDCFATWRINWNDKASNIKEIAEELNVGLDSMVFIDDSPSERELIRQSLPMVAVPEFPSQPYDLIPFYKHLVEDYFRVYTLTDEDRAKTEQYKANALRAHAKDSFTNLESFIKSLDIHIKIEAANDFNIPRIAQMTQKTNQFNLTTKRYTESDIRVFLDSGWDIYCMSVSDRFGDYGITGCILINDSEIDSFLLSCRILGKDIEFAFVKKILELLRDKGHNHLSATYYPTGKNAQVKEFYDRCGFIVTSIDESENKTYYIDLHTADLSIKPYYQISIC